MKARKRSFARCHTLVPEEAQVALEELLTVAEVAQHLRLTQDTIRTWCRTGKLRATLLSRKGGYRIPRSELQRILRDHARDWVPPKDQRDTGSDS